MGAGSSGIRAPAPTPEPQRKEDSASSTSPRGGIIMSSHDAAMCQDLAGGGGVKSYTGLGSSMARLEGALVLAGARGGRNEYSDFVP